MPATSQAIGYATMSPASATISDAEPVADRVRHLIGSISDSALATDHPFFAPAAARSWAKITVAPGG